MMRLDDVIQYPSKYDFERAGIINAVTIALIIGDVDNYNNQAGKTVAGKRRTVVRRTR